VTEIDAVAFSMMFYVTLGPVMSEYSSQVASIVALCRALFGDFDIDEIINNSSGYMNAILFIAYLFVAVFIMLSMFFAILGESQAGLRDEQREAKQKDTLLPEYGVFEGAINSASKLTHHMPILGEQLKQQQAKDAAMKAAEHADAAPTALDRIEARQLELADQLAALRDNFKDVSDMKHSIKDVREIAKRLLKPPALSKGKDRPESASESLKMRRESRRHHRRHLGDTDLQHLDGDRSNTCTPPDTCIPPGTGSGTCSGTGSRDPYDPDGKGSKKSQKYSC
jgi:hypothetical protein